MKKYKDFLNENVWYDSVLVNQPDLIILKNKLEGKHKVDINEVDGNGETLLGRLCHTNEKYALPLIEYLLKQPDLDVNVIDAFGKDALQYACNWEHIRTIKLLLQHPKIRLRRYIVCLDFIDLLIKDNTDTSFLKDYKLQKVILENNKIDIILLFNKYGLVNDKIKKEYPHILTGADLNLL